MHIAYQMYTGWLVTNGQDTFAPNALLSFAVLTGHRPFIADLDISRSGFTYKGKQEKNSSEKRTPGTHASLFKFRDKYKMYRN